MVSCAILISTTIAILIRKGQDYSIWLYGGLVFYLFYSGWILLLRDTRIEKKVATNHFKNSDSKKYDTIQLLKYLHYTAGSIFILASLIMLIHYLNNRIFVESIELLSFNYLLIFGGFSITVTVNVFLKYFRHKLVHIPVYEYNKEEEEKKIDELKTIVK